MLRCFKVGEKFVCGRFTDKEVNASIKLVMERIAAKRPLTYLMQSSLPFTI